MSFSLKDKKTQNLIVGLFTLLVALWLVMFAVPDLFINLFDTLLGNLILIAFIILAGIYNIVLGLGLAVVFVVLFRLSHH
jgi:nicotinamide riboside transporter PnuC